MSEPTLSAYVARCQKALEEYSRLRFLGISHDIARRQSGFELAVMGKPADPVETMREVRRIIANDSGE
jgi:hypothetical protein